MNFSDKFPHAKTFNRLGDDITYHAVTGDIAVKAIVDSRIEPVFSGGAQINEKRLQVDVITSTVPGLKKGSKFTINGVKNTVDAIIDNDGVVSRLVVR